MRVLFVDEHVQAVASVREFFEWMGHDCHLATTGLDALELCARFDLDLALVDISLPDMCGFELGRAVRQHARHQPYLVAMAGWSHSEHRYRALDAGFDAHVIKPLDMATLTRLVGTSPRALRSVAPALTIVR